MYKEHKARYEYTRFVIWKYGNVWVFIRGMDPLGSDPTGPGSGFSVLPYHYHLWRVGKPGP